MRCHVPVLSPGRGWVRCSVDARSMGQKKSPVKPLQARGLEFAPTPCASTKSPFADLVRLFCGIVPAQVASFAVNAPAVADAMALPSLR